MKAKLNILILPEPSSFTRSKIKQTTLKDIIVFQQERNFTKLAKKVVNPLRLLLNQRF